MKSSALFTFLLTGVAAEGIAPLDLAPAEQRVLESNNFRATYKARYQHLADASCGGPQASIQVFCRGKIIPVSLTSSTIECSALTNVVGWNGIHCENTCQGLACQQLYVERSQEVETGSFGEIIFQCIGENETGVDAYMSYVGGQPGFCTAAAEEGGDGRNYHIAQLGVQCPNALGPFSFDDYYFECGSGTTVGKFGGHYSCYSGANCQGKDCRVPFENIFINADSHNFHACIEALGDMEVGPGPSIETFQTESEPGFYQTRFQANWQLKLDTNYCRGEFAAKRITCLDDTRITNVEPLFDNVECTMISDSVMECKDTTPKNFINGFSGVQYDCAGTKLPETMIEYMSADSVCETATPANKQVGHYLQLGVVCFNPRTNGTVVANLDTFFECGQNNDFDVVGGKYTCQQVNYFDRFSPEVSVPLEPLTMRTDFRWSSARPDICFQQLDETMEPTMQGIAEDEDQNGETSDNGGFMFDIITPAPTWGNTTPGIIGPPAPTAPIAPGQPVQIPVAPTMAMPVVMTSAPTTEAPTREPLNVPEGTIYSVDFKGRFLQVKSPGCTVALPSIVLACTGDIGDVKTSHPSIKCQSDTITLDDGRSAVLCDNTCVGDEACQEVFLSVTEIGGTFGEIFFTCSGPSPYDIDGTFILVEGEPGYCDGTDPIGNSYNLKLAQLAVNCPTEDGGRDYVVDSIHADCGLQNRPISVDSSYTCFAGLACGTNPCQVDFQQLIVAADPHRFGNCTQVNNDEATIPILEAPAIPSRENGTYVGTFKAIWEFNFDSSCQGGISPKIITCTNGIIREVRSFGTDAPCKQTGPSTIECIDTTASGGIIYECEAYAEIPMSKVEYSEGNALCDSIREEEVERLLQMGIQCGAPGEEFYVYGDIFLECGEQNAFDIKDGTNFTCLQPVYVPASNTSLQSIPKVEIFTDYRWALFTSELCYNYTAMGVRRRELSQRGVDLNGALPTMIMSPQLASSASRLSYWTSVLGSVVFAGLVLVMGRWQQ